MVRFVMIAIEEASVGRPDAPDLPLVPRRVGSPFPAERMDRWRRRAAELAADKGLRDRFTVSRKHGR